jgi:hypothetical protein
MGSYRAKEVDVPKDAPFKNDALDRKPLVDFLSPLVTRVGGPFVLALDSPWGTGKTTVVRMLRTVLENDGFQCLYFNAWQADYTTDPLVALVSAVDQVKLNGKAAAAFKSHMDAVKRLTSLVAKRGAVFATKALTAGILDLDEEIEKAAEELAGEVVDDVVKAFQKEKELLAKFRAELEKAVSNLPSGGKKETLIMFVDELDRCRPTFAVELLERTKHLFDVHGICFILSVDRSQLEASIKAVYGDIDATEYLRRFIDLDYRLPAPSTRPFIEMLLKDSSLSDAFAQRTHPDLAYDKKNFVDYFLSLSVVTSMSLRAIERSIVRLKIVMDQTPIDHYLYPELVALLIALRMKNPSLFNEIGLGRAGRDEIVDYLHSLSGAASLFTGRSMIILEAYLIAADGNEKRRTAMLDSLDAARKNAGLTEEARNRAAELFELHSHIVRKLYHGIPSLERLVSRVEMTAGVQ